MELISNILMASGAFAAAIYCIVLSRRLARFTKLESGMGGAIAVLSAQVDDMTRALEKAGGAATASSESLEALTRRAETVAGRIELLLASLHDLPEAPETAPEPAADTLAGNRRVRFIRRRPGARADHDYGEAAE